MPLVHVVHNMDSMKDFNRRENFIFKFISSCGVSGAHCGVVAYSNCRYTACGAGLCCTRYG